jgi:hypothetical protein
MSLIFNEERFILVLPIAYDGVIPMLQDEGENLAGSKDSWIQAYRNTSGVLKPCSFHAILTEKIRKENPRYNKMNLIKLLRIISLQEMLGLRDGSEISHFMIQQLVKHSQMQSWKPHL